MLSALRAFLTRLIDYAGLFPPASLALEPALRNYAAYCAAPEAWMLARFICPAAQLADLTRYIALFSETSPLEISALGPRANTADEFLAALESSLKKMAAFSVEHGPAVSLPAIELSIPASVRGRAALRALLTASAQLLATSPAPLTPFFEIIPGPDGKQNIADAVEAIAEHNAHRSHPAGFKLRTGGVTAEAFPSPELIAFTVTFCHDQGVPLKCTAGLHHPIRRYDESVQTKMHGFVNVFGAGLLAHAHALNASTVQAILADEDPAHFCFSDDGFAWQDLHASTETIAAARQTALLSFGSCSFEEPRDDLRALGWL